MKNTVVDFLNNFLQLERVKGSVSRFLYRYLNDKVEDSPEICFLNYGFAPLNGSSPELELQPRDEANRVYIQLYQSVLGGVDLAGRDVLEVSSGRGGGSRYVKEYRGPRMVCGLDRAARAVVFCTRTHAQPGLRFVCGDAQRIPFPDASFDVVINVEASHDYLKLESFLSEVKRVLRPGGHFLYTDFRKREDCDKWLAQIGRSGLTMVEQEDITPNVVKGLEQNTEHNSALVKKLAPRPLRSVFFQFAGVKGSCIYERFDSGRSKYLRFVLRKQ